MMILELLLLRCFVLSPDFMSTDESQVLLKVPRRNSMYNVDMKDIVPKENLTCLVAKVTLDESMGKQQKASCKSKIQNSISQTLFMLHMDLFGPIFVSSLMHKKYGLVVTNDYIRCTSDEGVTLVDETHGRSDQDMFDTSIFDDEEVVAEKEVSTAGEVVTTAEEEVTTAGVKVSTAAITSHISMDEITLAKALIDIKTSKPKAKGIVIQELKIDILFNNTMKWIEAFVPMDTELVKGSKKAVEGSEKAQEGSSKRAAGKLEQEDAKRVAEVCHDMYLSFHLVLIFEA
nr:hypothetical protein [Tanacetum cinerariifolium]